MNMTDMPWEVFAGTVVSWVGQQLKAMQKVPTLVVQVAMLGAGVGLYALHTPPVEPYHQWWRMALTWGMLIVAGSSVLAATPLAPKTDSK